ncbi:hypothetical protein GCM10025864_28430 [Luteimicrobium album]|uniref:Uncharacterized protein n=1 Tax=Luteimicrobium album TaxID=1054550 RepID=A0ABQ6I5K8_9MICO|nr:hypothetical protein GCM10025864_28430 [Luteimicrobium album]
MHEPGSPSGRCPREVRGPDRVHREGVGLVLLRGVHGGVRGPVHDDVRAVERVAAGGGVGHVELGARQRDDVVSGHASRSDDVLPEHAGRADHDPPHDPEATRP